jgi:hypothetical protein
MSIIAKTVTDAKEMIAEKAADGISETAGVEWGNLPGEIAEVAIVDFVVDLLGFRHRDTLKGPLPNRLTITLREIALALELIDEEGNWT